jgi:protein OS-9
MTTNDQIYLIKELAICQYVLIIHSPHLCSLPGFRPEKVDVEPAGIQCRQVMKDEEYRAWQEREDLGELPSLRPPGLEAESTIGGDIADSEGPSLKELLKKAYESKQAQLGGAGSAKDAVRGSGDQADVAGREQEVMFISIEEDEEGNAAMVLDTEAMLQTILGEAKTEVQAAIQAAGEGGHDLADKEREMIIKAVREFLGRTRASKGKDGDDEMDEARVRDEL